MFNIIDEGGKPHACIISAFRYCLIGSLVGILLISSYGCEKEREPFPSGEVVDLSHPFDEETIYWPTEKGFEFNRGFEGITPGGYYYSANSFCSAEHGGTHIDAPVHFYENGESVDGIPLDRLMGHAVVIDVSPQCAGNRDYQILIEDFVHWEKRHGMIPDGSIVLLRTGSGAFWPNRLEYLGTDERGPDAVAKLHFPGLHPETAQWLANGRSIKAIGIDTPSIDFGQSTGFESHVKLFEKNIPVFENLANLDQLPPENFNVIALPMKIKGGSGGPLRIVALL